MSPTSCANNHPLMLEVRAHFTALGLVSCHIAWCPNSASPYASRVTAPHDRAPLCYTRMLLCPALTHSLTSPCALRERSRVHAPTHLQDVARAALARSYVCCCRAPPRLSHSTHLLPRPSLRVRLALLSCLPKAHPCYRQGLAQSHNPSHSTRPTRPKVVTVIHKLQVKWWPLN